MQIARLGVPSPVVWPAATFAPRFAPGSVNLIYCQDQVLDLRNWPADADSEEAILITYRCRELYADHLNFIAKTVLKYSCTFHMPCDVRLVYIYLLHAESYLCFVCCFWLHLLCLFDHRSPLAIIAST